MPTERMTFSVPAKLKKRLKKHRDVNWSGVVAKALEQRVAELELLDKLTARSKLTQSDVDEIADSINDAMARRLGLK